MRATAPFSQHSPTQIPVATRPSRDKELEEARSRVAQLQKTLRWWSDCTASWREKWTSLRDERNHLRDKVASLQQFVNAAFKSMESMKTERDQFKHELDALRDKLANSSDLMESSNHFQFGNHDASEQDDKPYESTALSSEISDTTGTKHNVVTNSGKNALLSTVDWWKTQCSALEQEVGRLFNQNTQNQSKCELLILENRLLKHENDMLKSRICSNENQLDSLTHDSSSTVTEGLNGISMKPDLSNTSVQGLTLQLSERESQLDLLQRRLFAVLRERKFLSRKLEESNIIRRKLEQQLDRTEKCQLFPDRKGIGPIQRNKPIMHGNADNVEHVQSDSDSDEMYSKHNMVNWKILFANPNLADEEVTCSLQENETVPDQDDVTLGMNVSTLNRMGFTDEMSDSWVPD